MTTALPAQNEPADATPPPRAVWGDRLFRGLCQIAGLIIVGLAVAMVMVLAYDAWPTLKNLWKYQFFTSDVWDRERQPPEFGSLTFVYGTIVSSLIAMAIAVPMGVGSAAWLAEVAPASVRRIGAFLVELLAAVPSVVYGFWGIDFLRPRMEWLFVQLGVSRGNDGKSILTAGVLLAIMIVPYITAIAFDACRSVPRAQREAALALGATRWQMIKGAVLPYARPAIIAACFLALGRALGETMAVIMVIGQSNGLQPSPFAPGDSIAGAIANRVNEADTPDSRAAVVTLALILLLITSALNIAGRLLIRRGPGRASGFNLGRFGRWLSAAGRFFIPVRIWNPLANHGMTLVLGSCLVASLIPLFLILGHVLNMGIRSMSLTFFTNLPLQTPPGLKNGLVGSGILVALTLVMAVPLGVLAAVYLAESRSRRLAPMIRFIAEVLGGVPSVVLGIFAYTVLVAPPWGDVSRRSFSAWAGAFALAIMMIPVVVRSAEEALRMVPGTLREASYALGANFRQTVLKVIIPAALPAVLTGVILATSRIAGETAPLLLTAGESNFMPRGLSRETPFLPGYIYKYANDQEAIYQQQAWSAALVLLGTVMLLNITMRLVTGKRIVAASHGA